MSNRNLQGRVGQIFSQNELKKLKEQAQIESKAKIIKINQHENMLFICKYAYQYDCKFIMKFKEKKHFVKIQNSTILSNQTEKYYMFIEISGCHTIDCIFTDEELQFYKIKKQLVDLESKIKDIVQEAFNLQAVQLLPLEVMKRLGDYLEKGQKFLYQGFEQNKNLKRKIKKKFDNIVAQMKKEIFPPKNLKKINKKNLQKVKQLNQKIQDKSFIKLQNLDEKCKSNFKLKNQQQNDKQQDNFYKSIMNNEDLQRALQIQDYNEMKSDSDDIFKKFLRDDIEVVQNKSQKKKLSAEQKIQFKISPKKNIKRKKINKKHNKKIFQSNDYQVSDDNWIPGKNNRDYGFIE